MINLNSLVEFSKNKKSKKFKKSSGEVVVSSVVPEPGEFSYEQSPPIFPTSMNNALEEKIHADSACNIELCSVTESVVAASCQENTDSSSINMPEFIEIRGESELGAVSEKSCESLSGGQQSLPAEPEPEVDTPTAVPSLLMNEAFIKLVEECVEVMDEFEAYVHRLPSREEKEIAALVVHRMQELLERSGLERIVDEEHFSVLRHRSDPVLPVTDGHPLAETLVSGLRIENRVFKKAVVKLKKEESDDL